MSKGILLPRLAFMGIRKNMGTYAPYIAACIFSVFAYFTFDSILYNDIMQTLPRSAYAWVLMRIGFVLLTIILTPFLFYTNSFLIKRRKRELGLYSILGLEKKHIGLMIVLETAYIYIIVLVGGIVCGVVFAKLLFLWLLNITGLPVETSFTFQFGALRETCLFFAFISVLNLIENIRQVGKASPTELMRQSKKGEKETKRIWIWALAGALLLGYGYYLAMTSELDGNIFLNFFMAVFVVVLGTYFLFTSGSIALLRILKKNKKFYYKGTNFVTISGMLYRMKKNAASLVNICIFATMVTITLLCTLALYWGTDNILQLMYPHDAQLLYTSGTEPQEVWKKELMAAADQEGVTAEIFTYRYSGARMIQAGEQFEIAPDNQYWGVSDMYFIPLSDFNRMEQHEYTLQDGEILIYSLGNDYGYPIIYLENNVYQVKEELADSKLGKKMKDNRYKIECYIIMTDEALTAQGIDVSGMINNTCISLKGEAEQKEAFLTRVSNEICADKQGFLEFKNDYGSKKEVVSMYGGLLFIGVFFSVIFLMCMVLIMYYKQITEGFEDKDNFDIMQKVGMSDKEVKSTISRQILLVFFLPLAGAVLHTLAALKMIIALMGALNLFHTGLIVGCAGIVIVVFSGVYGGSYLVTAKSYYRIVRKMERN